MWPFLLGHYKFNSTFEEREELDRTTKQYYETTMTEWLAVEAIVRQKDKEIMAANIAKLSSESTSGEPAPLTPGLQNDISNDVSWTKSVHKEFPPKRQFIPLFTSAQFIYVGYSFVQSLIYKML